MSASLVQRLTITNSLSISRSSEGATDTVKMNSTISETTELEYLLWDLVPIGFSFLVGVVILVTLLFFVRCRKCGNTLIVWLYGGNLTRMEENGDLFINVAESGSLKCLRSLLVANAVTLATLLTMIFCDTFFVKTNLGCLENLDCYIADSNYIEPPLNCSHFINQKEKIVCYQFILDFFQAFADTGGVLAVATLGVVVMTKLWIYCGKSRCNDCVLYICKVVAITVLVGIVIGMHVLMYLYNRESYTFLKEIGLVLKLLAVGFSIFVTTMTPWHVLKQDPALNVDGILNVNHVT